MLRSADRAEGGYLLVEALVALAITAAMAGMVFSTVWQSAHTRQYAARHREAILLARSVLSAAQVGQSAPIPLQGSDGNLAWSWRAEPWSGSESDGLALQQVRVVITDAADGRELARLTSLRSVP